jgi:thiol-disulfide isomerase/thioredoxin
MAADTQADQDWLAYQNASKPQPPKPLSEMSRWELSDWAENYALRLREVGLAFVEKHPADPRRWNVISRFGPGTPRFVKDWGPLDEEGVPSNPVIDQAAAKAWRAKVAELQVAMGKAGDLPDDVKKLLAERAEIKARRQAFATKWQSGLRTHAPDFAVRTPDDREVKLSDFRGKTVVIDFWATWCHPCNVAMPHNEEVAEHYADQNVILLAVCTLDTKDKFDAWLKANQARYPHVVWAFDPAAKSENNVWKTLYDGSQLPTQFVIDPAGNVADAVVGYSKGETVLEVALSKAGIKVDPALVAKGIEDLKKHDR